MKVFLFSSPYQYYADNLIPLAKYLSKQAGFIVNASYQLKPDDTDSEISMLTGEKVKYSSKFLKNIKPDYDAVILTQPWWYQESKIADKCKKHKIPFFIVDHAPPMMRYTRGDGLKSHLYRSDLRGAHTFFAYGKKTIEIMKSVGCKSRLEVVGSSRIESMLEKIKEIKDGYVLFDTSNKMEDKNIVPLFMDFVSVNRDKNFLIREHSRSPKFFRKALKFSNVRVDNDIKEYELYKYSNFIFTFPSSAMLMPALLNKNIFSLYQNHYCYEARQYNIEYCNLFPSLGSKNKKTNYELFLTNNLLYSREEDTNTRILKYLKSKI